MLSTSSQRVCIATNRFWTVVPRRTIRSVSTSTRPTTVWKNALFKDRRIAYVAGGASIVTIGLLLTRQGGSRDPDDPRDMRALSTVPLVKLFSGWTTFAFCSSPTWVDMAETMYNIVSKVPIVSSISHAFVMQTFFNQFLGGETTEDCIPKIKALREHQIGTLLGYNIEAELDGSSKDPQLILAQTQHVLSSVEAQGKLAKKLCPDTSATGGDNRSWIRIKVTGLLPHPVALYHSSNAILKVREERGLDKDVPYPGLPHDGDWEAALSGQGATASDREQLLSLRATLEAIASKARDNNVRIVIDVEQSWYQPVIDSLTDELMQTYNSLDGALPSASRHFRPTFVDTHGF
ncbi:hypothetical protein ACJ41O_014656 [Fusarium nematophilum]